MAEEDTRGDGAESDRDPAGESTAEPFIAECPDCTVTVERAEFDESAAFVSKHREHTGHRMEWTRAEFGMGLRPETAWELTCETCADTWTFGTESEALAFRREHAEYTDHEIEREPEHRGLAGSDGASLTDLIADLSEHFDGGVPEPLVHAHAGGDRETVRAEIQQLKRQGTVFEPSPFRLQAV
jgi:hypothetical protein